MSRQRSALAGQVSLRNLAGGDERVNSACERDYYRFCAKYSIGTPELRSCMLASRRALSRRCVDALVAAGEVPKRYLTSKR